MGLNIKVQEISYHRNGVCGEGFYVVLFTQGLGKDKERMVATLFDTGGQCAVLNVDLLDDDICAFGENSYRGADDFEPILRKAIAEYEARPITF